MPKWKLVPPFPVLSLFLIGNLALGQSIPDAPPTPVCGWDSAAGRSTCKFKDVLSGTPTSVVGKKVILFDRSNTGGHGVSRQNLREAMSRLSARYGFTAIASDDMAVFSPDTLADARAIIVAYGDGDVVPAGRYRNAMQDFQMVSGWGMIWIHAACAFITSGWQFGQQSCVQQYFHHNPSGTQRKIFLDSGTATNPEQGRKSPQSEFLLRDLPGWNGQRSIQLGDEWFCFQSPARNTVGVNVLFGYDRSSGLPTSGCPEQNSATESASQNHNLAWTHPMGKGITIVNSWGHDIEAYTRHGNMGDSLLWRYIRYVAKDWCISGSGAPGCDATVGVRAPHGSARAIPLEGRGGISVPLPAEGRYTATVTDLKGRRAASGSMQGPGVLEIPGIKRGLYLLRIEGKGKSEARRVMVY